MKIIEIETLENGAHRNLEEEFIIPPEGWALIPDDMETPNFPFGEVEVKIANGMNVVTKWTPNELPEGEVEKEITTGERLAALEAAMLEMVLGGTE